MIFQTYTFNEQQAGLAAVATVGTFDGVHRGHQYLISQVKAEAARRHQRSMVITFDRHPASLFGHDKPLLTTNEEKFQLIKQTGVDILVVLTFDRPLAALTAETFMEQLRTRLNVSTLVVGYDNHFGSDQRQVQPGPGPAGIDVVAAGAFTADTLAVSSSAIRNDLLQGDVTTAGSRLGRPYRLTGEVVHGQHVGTQLGFPTANLRPSPSLLIPMGGAYAVRTDKGQDGILNIGCRPTFHGQEKTIEVHLIGYDGDLYGQPLTIDFIRRLRDEQAFASPEALIAQLQRDKAQAIHILHEQ